jgi:tetratricopeptide (TPR) repeat protein
MGFASVAALLFAQLASAGPAALPDLAAAAAASPRPRECTPEKSSKPSLWEAAASPRLARFCRELARGYSQLMLDPKAAVASARRAEEALAGRAGPRVLQARATLALGDPAGAYQHFVQARKIDKRSVEAPQALHDLAVASARSGQQEQAVAAYRSVVPRAGLLPSSASRQRVYVEAGVAVMHLGPDALDEAIGYLGEARRRGSLPGFSQYALGALALALDRQGRGDEASAVASEAGEPWSLARILPDPDEEDDADADADGDADEIRTPAASAALAPEVIPVLPVAELHAMVAILAEREDPALALQHWQIFIELVPSSGPWAAHAKQKVAAVTRRAGR